jgi:hypothetical protein
MTEKSHVEFDTILRFALDQGLTNIFEIAAWWSQGCSDHEILNILRPRVQRSRYQGA